MVLWNDHISVLHWASPIPWAVVPTSQRHASI
uniref:Uncharacterized protein n=1 Tax=Anguilla anguilla TaxID=7936 RepID=A0A0E9R4V1_ANGAN